MLQQLEIQSTENLNCQAPEDQDADAGCFQAKMFIIIDKKTLTAEHSKAGRGEDLCNREINKAVEALLSVTIGESERSCEN